MNNNPKNPIADLQQQQLLLRMEYEYKKEGFKRQTETMGVARKVKRGLCWYPVSLGRSYYNSLNQLVIDITCTGNKEIGHSFEFDCPVCFSISHWMEKCSMQTLISCFPSLYLNLCNKKSDKPHKSLQP